MPLYFQSHETEREDVPVYTSPKRKGNRPLIFLMFLVAVVCLTYAVYGFFFKAGPGTDLHSKLAHETGAGGPDRDRFATVEVELPPLEATPVVESSPNRLWELNMEAIRQRQQRRDEQLKSDPDNSVVDEGDEWTNSSDRDETSTFRVASKSTQKTAEKQLAEAEEQLNYALSVQKICRLIMDSAQTCTQLCGRYSEFWQDAREDMVGSEEGYMNLDSLFDESIADQWQEDLDMLKDEADHITNEYGRIPSVPERYRSVPGLVRQLLTTYRNYVSLTRHPYHNRYSIDKKSQEYLRQCEDLNDLISSELE
ncbi:hypothetical protein JXQ70_07495 [bacterium]|nr:hypothetical protein [bacterium]